MLDRWFLRRRQLRETARELTREFDAVPIDHVSFGVRALGGKRLELVVWPEDGVDTFEESAEDSAAVESAASEFRRIVRLYESGQRPPFLDD